MKGEELRKLLNYYDDLYYNHDISEISDDDYNELKDRYIAEYGEYKYVPGKASNKFEKFNHLVPVLSLDKVQITEEDKLRAHLVRLWPVVIQPKMDGLTIVCYRVNNKIIFVTRGNGYIGEIVTANVENVEGLGASFAFPVRMEVVMMRSYFNAINEKRAAAGLEPFDNCRNAAAGMLRNLDSSKVEGLKAFAYNILFEEESEENANAQAQIDYLQGAGWNTVDSYEPKDIDDAVEYIKNFDREALDYDIDGLVIKNKSSKVFGSVEHHPLNAVAVKFVPPGAWTRVLGVNWTVKRTGKVTPVFDLEPVYISGSTITKATGHNYEILKAIGLTSISTLGKRGDSVTEAYVVKSNDVIPKVLETRLAVSDMHNVYTSQIQEPEFCPVCGSRLEKEGPQSFCRNELCSAKIVSRLIHMAQRDAFDIDGLGIETAPKLVDKIMEKYNHIIAQISNTEEVMTEEDDMYDIISNKIKNLHTSFIYDLTYEDILSIDGFAHTSALNLKKAINKSLVIPFDRFLYGCGIPLVGKKAARDIAEFYFNDRQCELKEFVEDYLNDFEKLKTLKGIGPETIASINKYYDSLIVPFGEYPFDIQDIIPKKKNKEQKIFVITGSFDIPRTEIKKMITDAGHKVTGSVSSKTSYLVCGEKPGSKLDEAQKLNTVIIHSLDELNNILQS